MKYLYLSLLVVCVFISSCKVNYSFTGGSVPAQANTFSVDYFSVNAPLASPTINQVLTEGLKDYLLGQTRLDLAKNNGDIQYSGVVTNYTISPIAIQSDESASTNRLSVTIKVNYVNVFEEEKNSEKSFTRFADFDRNTQLSDVEETLLEEIVTQLVQDIFNSTLGDW
ncbi:MAG: hypothetical protein ACJAUV_001546 [Flavobacteriales bacterium]|jgi:hypothetical protein